jgi:hypothetical protein
MERQPDFFTVEEAAEIVRIGRTLAYQEAARFMATDGAEGLPVIRVGRLLRVPRARLEAWVGGPLTAPRTNGEAGDAKRSEPSATPPRRIRSASSSSSDSNSPAAQPQLPLALP